MSNQSPAIPNPSRLARQQLDPDEWIDTLAPVLPKDEIDCLRRARKALGRGTAVTPDDQAAMLHKALTVADILVDLKLDAEVLAVPFLCAALETGGTSEKQIADEFGPRQARLVADVYRLEALGDLRPEDGVRPKPAQLEGLRKLLLSVVQDIRVLLVKLADRLFEMRDLSKRSVSEQRSIAQETLDIFAPLANRLGIGQLKWELEDYALRYLHPMEYRNLARQLAERRSDRQRFIEDLVDGIETELRAVGLEAEVTGRPKHIYSIWRKMRRKNLRFDQVFDVRAVRVLVSTVPECYTGLGVVHSLWKPIREEFDDYIANPKRNGYQSLHTAVVGAGGKIVEIQIRTREMHENAELGVAAHWRYKENEGRQRQSYEDKIAWLRHLLESKDEMEGNLLDRFQSEAFEDRVYVLTPTGDILDLPQGATPVDFAYKLHSEVGHCCRGSKVNGRIVPLTYALQNGERVEILTAKQGGPSRDWLNPNLNYLKSPRARAKVRSWFRQADRQHNIAGGRGAVEREFSRLGIRNVNLSKIAERLGFESAELMFVAVGFGDVTVLQVAGAAQEQLSASARLAPRPVKTPRAEEDFASDSIQVRGVGKLLTTLARCCKPVPPEPILGYITLGRGVSIHRKDCRNALNLVSQHGERLIEVDWGVAASDSFPVDIWIEAYDRTGLLRDITTLLAAEKVNVLTLNTDTDRDNGIARSEMTIEVGGLAVLARALDRLTRLPNVIAAGRRGR